MKCMIVFFSFLPLFTFALAQNPTTPKPTGHVLLTPEEIALQEKAKKRMYPGGRDEEPIVVQAQLVPPVRKMGPASEAPEDEPHD